MHAKISTKKGLTTHRNYGICIEISIYKYKKNNDPAMNENESRNWRNSALILRAAVSINELYSRSEPFGKWENRDGANDTERALGKPRTREAQECYE